VHFAYWHRDSFGLPVAFALYNAFSCTFAVAFPDGKFNSDAYSAVCGW